MNARTDGKPQNKTRTKHPDLPYGVYWRNRLKPYIVKFRHQKRTVNIGSYATLDEAINVANSYIALRS